MDAIQTYLNFSPASPYPVIGVKLLCPEKSIRCLEVNIAPNQHILRGAVMCETSTRGLFEPWRGQADARGILRFTTWTDADGNCTVDGPNIRWGQLVFLTVPLIVVGQLLTRQLIGLTASSLQTLGRILEGTIDDGILDMP